MYPSETHTWDRNLYLRALWWFRVRWGCRWPEGGGVNIAPGLSLGPLAFMASQENKTPQETQCRAHMCVRVCVFGEQWGVWCFIHYYIFTCAYSCVWSQLQAVCKGAVFMEHVSGPLSTEKEAAVGYICLFPLLAGKLYSHLVIGRWRESFMTCSEGLYDNKPLYLQDCVCVCGGRGVCVWGGGTIWILQSSQKFEY